MAKNPNYTVEQEQEIRSAFENEVDHKAIVIELANVFGKSIASVRQKAVRMGLYKKATYVSKTGEKPESKESIVADIAKQLDVNIEVAESLAKANKTVLLKVRSALEEKELLTDSLEEAKEALEDAKEAEEADYEG